MVCPRNERRARGCWNCSPAAERSVSRWPDRIRVLALEGDAALVAACHAAVNKAGLMGKLEIRRRDLARQPLLANEWPRFAAVVLDPPHTGRRRKCRSSRGESADGDLCQLRSGLVGPRRERAARGGVSVGAGDADRSVPVVGAVGGGGGVSNWTLVQLMDHFMTIK